MEPRAIGLNDPIPGLFARYRLKDSSEGFLEVKIMQVLTGKISNLVTRVFGCWHAELSRPFSRGGGAYRKCLSCGAPRRFNLGNWEMQGKFFYSN
jgi:hypothetical protein